MSEYRVRYRAAAASWIEPDFRVAVGAAERSCGAAQATSRPSFGSHVLFGVAATHVQDARRQTAWVRVSQPPPQTGGFANEHVDTATLRLEDTNRVGKLLRMAHGQPLMPFSAVCGTRADRPVAAASVTAGVWRRVRGRRSSRLLDCAVVRWTDIWMPTDWCSHRDVADRRCARRTQPRRAYRGASERFDTPESSQTIGAAGSSSSSKPAAVQAFMPPLRSTMCV